ncbi:MAG: hypothetical protein ACYCSB_01370 [bacterium]|jgi:hypothetical protein
MKEIILKTGEFSNGKSLELILEKLERDWKKDYALRSLITMKKKNEINNLDFQTFIKSFSNCFWFEQIYEKCVSYNRSLRFGN